MKQQEHTIKEMAKKIKEKIKGSSICGIPIDLDNQDHVLIAAYFAGKREHMKNEYKREMQKWKKVDLGYGHSPGGVYKYED